MAKLRIAIDDTPLHSGHAVRGMGFYVRNLISSLKAHPSVELVSLSEKPDILHIPYFDLFYPTLHIDPKQKTVVTVPDVIPLLYPHYYKPGIRGKRNFQRQKAELRNATAIITISETSKKDIVRLLGVPSDKVYVTWLGPGNSPQKTVSKLKLPKQFVLYAGDVNWNKNTIRLIKAVNQIKAELVIVGKHAAEVKEKSFQSGATGPRDVVRKILGKSHPELAHFSELHDLLMSSKNVHVMGFVETDDFTSIFQQASVYCQPSLYEGFGLPLLEAMQHHVPIVASRTQALVEVADDAAVYADPYSVDDLASQLRSVLHDSQLRQDLIKKGKSRLKQFSWEKSADQVVTVYQHAK